MTIRNTIAWERAASDGSRDAKASVEPKPPKGAETAHGYMTGYARMREAMIQRSLVRMQDEPMEVGDGVEIEGEPEAATEN